MAMKKLLVLLSFILLGLVAFAQAPKPPAPTPEKKYELTEVQSLRLQVRQKDALLAQQELNRAQTQFNSLLAVLNAEAAKIKLDNKWDEKVLFDAGTLTFRDPPPTPPAPKPEAEKKP